MREIVLHQTVSLDGFFEGPGGDISWHEVDDELHSYINSRLAVMGGFLSGRVTHQLMVDYWPTADEDPDAPAPIAEFARIWRDMPKFVFSRTLTSAGWNTTIMRDVLPAEIEVLKAAPGGDLVLSGAVLAETFLRYGLVDQVLLYVSPVVLGAGRSLFPGNGFRLPLRLAETKAFDNGTVMLRYHV
ncbi:dihydrofolate reductase family protein [Actinokineospora inagensis]|uniref:dihydrofolate reductase family protein n=1 Tax=Actinokineospora inagensis TaxID=103730 RepID=UPI00041992E3|nr:dihydrofolate reductase family protein [Actinokineospora inagensis]